MDAVAGLPHDPASSCAGWPRIFALAGTALALFPHSAASSMLIDFETLPGGEPTTEGEIGGAYAELGVEFSKFNADDPIGARHLRDFLLQPVPALTSVASLLDSQRGCFG